MTCRDLAPSPTIHDSVALTLGAGGDDCDRIDRFQSLEPGYYWTARESDGDGGPYTCYAAGETLLLVDITEFEHRAHSVTLRKHPSRGKGTFELLVDDFLSSFELCLDAESIRQREQQAVMNRVTELQGELVRVQSSPQLMYEAVREEVQKSLESRESKVSRERQDEVQDARKREADLRRVHRRAARRSEAKGNPLVAPRAALASEIGTVLREGINEAGVEAMGEAAQAHALVAQAQANWLTTQTRKITQTLTELTPYIEERAAVALARSSGAIKSAERIVSGVQSLNLYTGRGVDVYDVRAGRSAPSSEPLTLVQGKRFMDEELAVWADVDASFDFMSRDRFFEELARNDALLNQVLPTERCVVSMAVTRHSRHYANPLESLIYNLKNQLVFLLVRNGENVHAVYSSEPSHEAARRLFPTQDELSGVFRGFDGETISIRDVEFGRASKDFDDLALHYRRFLILLCGLDHRLQLFGEFYPQQESMRFMSLDFQSRYFRFLADDERGALLGEPLPALSEWIGSHNTALQSGSRVFILRSGVRGDHAPALVRRESLETLKEQFGSVFIAQREGQKHFVHIEVRERYGRDTTTERVKCYLEPAEAATDAWWLCVDAVDVEHVRRFRQSREHRAIGVGYLRLFRRIEAFLDSEAAQEAASREYLLKTAIEYGGLSPAVASAALKKAVCNWRAARRGEALPDVTQVARLSEVLNLMVPEGELPGAVDRMLEAYLEAAGLEMLLVTRTGKSRLHLYVAASDADRAPYPTVLHWGWVKRIVLEVGKTKLKDGAKSLVWLHGPLPASEVEVRRTEALAPWLNAQPEPLSLRRYAQVKAALDDAVAWDPVLRGGEGCGFEPAFFGSLFSAVVTCHTTDRSRYVPSVYLAIPMAAHSRSGRVVKLTSVRDLAERILFFYGNAEQRERVRAFYVGRYSRSGRDAALARLQEPPRWLTGALDIGDSTVVVRHDRPVTDVGLLGTSGVDWRAHRITRNEKRSSGWSSESSVELSFDRALAHLAGTVTTMARRAFYKKQAATLARELSWPHNTTERLAKIKETAAQRYEHPYRSDISPLFWPAGAARPVANKLLVAPTLSPVATKGSS